MLAPNSSALGPPGAKRGGGSSLPTDLSCFGVAGDAQATTHTSSTSVHTRGRAMLFSSGRPLASWLVGDLQARGLAITCLPYRLPRGPLRRLSRCALPAVPIALVGECSIPVVQKIAR